MTGTLQGYQGVVDDAAQNAGVPTSLFEWLIGSESSGNPSATNAGHYGLGQVDPATYADPGYGVTPGTDGVVGLLNPQENATFSAQLLAAYYKATGSWSAAIGKYKDEPASNYTQWDNATPDTTTDEYTSGTMSQPQMASATATAGQGGVTNSPTFWQGAQAFALRASGVQGALDTITSWSGWLGDYFIRGVVVIVGFIFVAAALYMIGNQGTEAASKLHVPMEL